VVFTCWTGARGLPPRGSGRPRAAGTSASRGPGCNRGKSESYKTSTSCPKQSEYSRDSYLLPAVSLVFLLLLLLLSSLVAAVPDSFPAVAAPVASPVVSRGLLEVLPACLDSRPALLSRSGGRRARAARRAAPSERVSVRVAPAVASGATTPGRGRGHVRKGRGGQSKDRVCVPS